MSLPDWNGRAKFSDFLSAQTIGEAVAGSGDSLFFCVSQGFSRAYPLVYLAVLAHLG
jgi:hypothetical protein